MKESIIISMIILVYMTGLYMIMQFVYHNQVVLIENPPPIITYPEENYGFCDMGIVKAIPILLTPNGCIK